MITAEAPVASMRPVSMNEVADLAHQLMNACLEEEGAKSRRIELEGKLLDLINVKEEGSDTIELPNGFKLTTTGKLSYKLAGADALKSIREIGATWTTGLTPLKTKTELDETGCKWLRQHAPQLWAQIAKFVEIKPAKTSVKVRV